MHFLAQHVQGNVATQSHLRKLPMQQEKRDLVTKPIQPDDVEDDRTVGIILWSLSSTTRALKVAVSLVSTAAEAVGVKGICSVGSVGKNTF